MGRSPQTSGEQETAHVDENSRGSWSEILMLGTLSAAIIVLFGRLLQNLRRETIVADKRLTEEVRRPAMQEFSGSPIPPTIPPKKQVSKQETRAGVAGSIPRQTDIDLVKSADKVRHTGYPTTSTHWPVATKYVVGVILFLAVVILVYVSRGVIPIIILAALLALIVHPVIRFLERRLKTSRGLAIGITYLLVIAVLLMIPLIFLPALINGVNSLLSIDYQALLNDTAQTLDEIASQVAEIPVLNVLLSPTLDSISKAIGDITSVDTPEPVPLDQAISGTVDRLSQMLGAITSFVGPLVSAITSLAFILLISFYISFSTPRMRVGYPKLLPPAYEPEITELISKITGLWTNFLRGQVALMFIVGVMVWLGNTILGNTAPLLLGIISGLLELIPNLGPALALIPGVTFALLFGSSNFEMPNWTFAIIVLVFYLLVQVVENQLIVPYVLGGAVDLPPLAVIIGVLVGGTVFGIIGALLAVPVIATGRDVFLYLYNKILEPPPEPEIPEGEPGVLDRFRTRLANIRLPFGLGRKEKEGEEAEKKVQGAEAIKQEA